MQELFFIDERTVDQNKIYVRDVHVLECYGKCCHLIDHIQRYLTTTTLQHGQHFSKSVKNCNSEDVSFFIYIFVSFMRFSMSTHTYIVAQMLRCEEHHPVKIHLGARILNRDGVTGNVQNKFLLHL